MEYICGDTVPLSCLFLQTGSVGRKWHGKIYSLPDSIETTFFAFVFSRKLVQNIYIFCLNFAKRFFQRKIFRNIVAKAY
jgi:hypothetical protein